MCSSFQHQNLKFSYKKSIIPLGLPLYETMKSQWSLEIEPKEISPNGLDQ